MSDQGMSTWISFMSSTFALSIILMATFSGIDSIFSFPLYCARFTDAKFPDPSVSPIT